MARAFKPFPIILKLIYNNFKSFQEVILFLGKNGKEVLKKAMKEWQFEYEEKKSITSINSTIIKIQSLKKK